MHSIGHDSSFCNSRFTVFYVKGLLIEIDEYLTIYLGQCIRSNPVQQSRLETQMLVHNTMVKIQYSLVKY